MFERTRAEPPRCGGSLGSQLRPIDFEIVQPELTDRLNVSAGIGGQTNAGTAPYGCVQTLAGGEHRDSLVDMNTTDRSALHVINGDRDRQLVHLGATSTNAELAELVARLRHRATLAVVAATRATPLAPTPKDA